jgi:2Fe-2S ferredoxin
MISFQVEDLSGGIRTIEVPEGINLNLMEVLKASDYDIQATCGGMALCATCHIEVEAGLDRLASKTDAELDMLDTLPVCSERSRLACQIKINEQLQNSFIKLTALA